MTREEEINYASKDYVNYLLDKQEYHNEDYTEDDIRQAFEKGAMFADNNPTYHRCGTMLMKIQSKIALLLMRLKTIK